MNDVFEILGISLRFILISVHKFHFDIKHKEFLQIWLRNLYQIQAQVINTKAIFYFDVFLAILYTDLGRDKWNEEDN